jgi:hypothetical protein
VEKGFVRKRMEPEEEQENIVHLRENKLVVIDEDIN